MRDCLYLCLFLFGISVCTQAQMTDAWLFRARKAYDNGNFAEAQQWVDSAFLKSPKLNTTQKAGGYKILALSTLYNGQNSQADSFTRALLNVYPAFLNQIKNEPLEFRTLLNRYSYHPKVSMMLAAGFGRNRALPGTRYSMAGETKNYQTGWVWDLALGLEYRPSLHWGAEFFGGLAQCRHQTSFEQLDYRIESLEQQKSISFRTMLKYFPIRNWSWGTGFSFDRITASYAFFTKTDVLQKTSEETEIDLQNVRKDNRPQWIFHTMYYHRNIFLGLLAGVDLQKLNRPDNRYDNIQALYSFSWVDDDFRLLQYRLVMGVRYNLLFKAYKKK